MISLNAKWRRKPPLIWLLLLCLREGAPSATPTMRTSTIQVCIHRPQLLEKFKRSNNIMLPGPFFCIYVSPPFKGLTLNCECCAQHPQWAPLLTLPQFFIYLFHFFYFFFAWNRWSLPAPRTPSDWPPSDCQPDEASLKKGLREEVRCCRRLPTPLLSVQTSQPVIDMQWRVCALILKSSINTFRKQWARRQYIHTDESGIRFCLGYMALGWKW